MPWIIPLITVAADLLGKGSKLKNESRQRSADIEQENLRNQGAILQGGRSSPNFSGAGAPFESEKGDSGIGAILQIAGSALGKSGGEAAPATGGGGSGGGGGLNAAIDALGSSSNKLTQPSLIDAGDTWHPLSDDSSVGDPDKWKSNATLGGYDPEDRWKKGLRL